MKAGGWADAWASTLLLLLWWYLATLCPADARPLPSPAEVVGAWNDLDAEGLLWPSIGISLLRVASGLALGIILAVPAGLVAGASRVGLAIIDKPIHMLRAVPFPALAPLFIVVFGIGETMKIGLITVGVFGLVYVGLRFALTVAWIALVTCETVNSSTGIGYMLSRSQQFSRTDQTVLCIVLYAILGLLSETIVTLLERAALPWRYARH